MLTDKRKQEIIRHCKAYETAHSYLPRPLLENAQADIHTYMESLSQDELKFVCEVSDNTIKSGGDGGVWGWIKNIAMGLLKVFASMFIPLSPQDKKDAMGGDSSEVAKQLSVYVSKYAISVQAYTDKMKDFSEEAAASMKTVKAAFEQNLKKLYETSNSVVSDTNSGMVSLADVHTPRPYAAVMFVSNSGSNHSAIADNLRDIITKLDISGILKTTIPYKDGTAPTSDVEFDRYHDNLVANIRTHMLNRALPAMTKMIPQDKIIADVNTGVTAYNGSPVSGFPSKLDTLAAHSMIDFYKTLCIAFPPNASNKLYNYGTSVCVPHAMAQLIQNTPVFWGDISESDMASATIVSVSNDAAFGKKMIGASSAKCKAHPTTLKDFSAVESEYKDCSKDYADAIANITKAMKDMPIVKTLTAKISAPTPTTNPAPVAHTPASPASPAAPAAPGATAAPATISVITGADKLDQALQDEISKATTAFQSIQDVITSISTPNAQVVTDVNSKDIEAATKALKVYAAANDPQLWADMQDAATNAYGPNSPNNTLSQYVTDLLNGDISTLYGRMEADGNEAYMAKLMTFPLRYVISVVDPSHKIITESVAPVITPEPRKPFGKYYDGIRK